MRHIRVSKLSDNPNPQIKQGDLGAMVMMLGPSIGKSFIAFNDSERFRTSEVKSIQYVNDKTIRFKTLNSEYEIVLGESFNE